MAAQKQYLHELLREDQQPFHLKSYISDRKSQLKLMMRDDSHSLVHVGTRKSFVETLTLKQRSLCKRGCLFSFRGSPEVGFPSPASAKTQNGRVLLHVPARTAALLLEAATRIQGPRIKNCGLGLFGSVLKRLKERNSKKKMREVKNIEEQHELGFPCAYNHRRRRRLSSAGWSDESNDDEKSLDLDLDLEASSSFRSEDFEEIADSPFRFSLHRCPSPDLRTPEFSSPAASPGLHKTQKKENCEDEDLENAKQKEDDKKEQCSPVSVLDHSFEDDNFKADEDDEDDLNPECSYSTLQKAQQELLYKLHRFEQLAELDPIELEKLMFDEEEEEEEEDVKERVICCRDGEINPYTKVQVSSQRSEENTEINDDLNNRKVVFGKVYNRVDFCRMGFEEWKNCRHQQAEEIAMEIEVVMFGVLVEELSQELSGS
nr:zinc-regulated protein 8-like [Ipomoea batatas]GME11832.1 zinc-regulated protein 8-like [Ipomoea batatas]